MSIDVILVDDHTIVRQGVKSVISEEADIRVVAEFSNGREAVSFIKKNSVDVVVMDITMPLLNGLEASRMILRTNPDARILVLSMHDNNVFIEKALSCGVKGYILKDSAIDEIVLAIREVYSGKFFLSSKISSYVIQDYAATKKKTAQLNNDSSLTDREREVLQLIAEGLSNKDIAKQLEISLKTVMAHRNNIMDKLDIHNQAHLIRFALKEGISSL